MIGKSVRKYHILSSTNGLKSLALLAIGVYIILMIVYESQNTALAGLSSLGLYASVGIGGLYIISARKLRITWLMKQLIVFGLLLSFSALYTKAQSNVVSSYLTRYWMTMILLFVISNVVEHEADVEFVMTCCILGGVGLAISMYLYYGWQYLLVLGERLGNEFGNQNYTSIRCSLTIVLSIYKMITNKGIKRLLWVLPAVIALPAVMFLASRKSWLVIFFGSIAVFVLYGRKTNLAKKVLLIFVTIGIMLFLVYNIPAFSVIKERFDSLFALLEGNIGKSDEGDISRQYYLRIGIDAFLYSPFWGNGFYYSNYAIGVHSHNNYVELLMNNGLMGFIAYYVMHVKLLIKAKKKKNYMHNMYTLVIVLVVVFLFMDFTITSYFDRMLLIYLVVCGNAVMMKNKIVRKSS